jgi:glycosyltransferase involved in cell wall biosynthesis
MGRLTIVETFNFHDYPMGGQQSFAKQLALAYAGRASLVGITTGEEPVGKWTTKELGGSEYPFFAFGRVDRNHGRPLIPRRLVSYRMIRRYRNEVLSRVDGPCLIQAPELLMATHRWPWPALCFLFAGTTNSLSISRYGWARALGGIYERKLFGALRDCRAVLASGDAQAIRDMVARSGGLLPEGRVIQFPTRVDTEVFHPRDRMAAREELGIPREAKVLVTSGRLAKVKGYDLLVEALRILVGRLEGNAHLYFIGDGEDRQDLEALILSRGLQDRAHVEGSKDRSGVAAYLNAADAVVVGSHFEGWSVAMLEAVACGVPVVSTAVSGARDLILEGVGGFVVDSRDPILFADAVLKALELKAPVAESVALAARYSLAALPADLDALLGLA